MNSFFDDAWADRLRLKPQILVLEVRHPDPARRESRPVIWLAVERHEQREHYPDGSLARASITLRYRPIDESGARAHGGTFDGSYDAFHNAVSLTSSSGWSEGAVFVDPGSLRGYRIGTYLMNEIVLWAQRVAPDASVQPVSLLSLQAYGGNRARRNRFYERFGLEFDYADASERAGQSRPMPVRELAPVTSWTENISEHNVLDYIATHLRAEQDNQRLQAVVAQLHGQMRAVERHPVRWAARRVLWRHGFGLGLTTLITVCAVAGWFRWTGRI